MTLCNALDAIFSSKAECALTAGLLTLDLDGEYGGSASEQHQVVRNIVNMVAKDTPTDSIRRLVQMMQNVYNCTRKHDESTQLYGRRFQSLAIEYLNHCDSAAAAQDSQNLSMLRLENANIPASVHSTVVTQMVSNATNRNLDPVDKIYLISKATLEYMIEKADSLAFADIDTSEEIANSIKNLALRAIKTNERHVQEDRTSFRVALDEAVHTLADMKVDDNTVSTKIEKSNIVFSMLGKRKSYDGHGNNSHVRNSRSKLRVPNGEGPKAMSKCRACGQSNH